MNLNRKLIIIVLSMITSSTFSMYRKMQRDTAGTPSTSPEKVNPDLFSRISGNDSQNSTSKISPDKLTIEEMEKDIKNKCEKEAIESLQSGDLESFDALVGEASCQIRAIVMVLIYRKMRNAGIDNLTDEEKEFATLSYMLTIAKEPAKEFDYDRRKLDHKRLNKSFPRHKVEKIINDAQRRLATLSVQYLQSLAAELADEEINKALRYVLIDHDQERFRRPHCACYPSISFILDALIAKDFPLVLVVRSWKEPLIDKLKLTYIPKDGHFMLDKHNQVNQDDPVVVISGYSNLVETNPELVLENFESIGIKDVILGTFATHPEFTGLQRGKMVPYQELGLTSLSAQKEKHRMIAETFGCSLNNKGLFLATHIFPSTFGKEFPKKSN